MIEKKIKREPTLDTSEMSELLKLVADHFSRDYLTLKTYVMGKLYPR